MLTETNGCQTHFCKYVSLPLSLKLYSEFYVQYTGKTDLYYVSYLFLTIPYRVYETKGGVVLFDVRLYSCGRSSLRLHWRNFPRDDVSNMAALRCVGFGLLSSQNTRSFWNLFNVSCQKMSCVFFVFKEWWVDQWRHLKKKGISWTIAFYVFLLLFYNLFVLQFVF